MDAWNAALRYLARGLMELRTQVEFRVLLLVGAVAGGLWAFAEVAESVLEGEARAVDRTLLLALRSPDGLSAPIGPRWLEVLGRDFTALGSAGVLGMLTLGVVCYLLLVRRRRVAAFVLGTIGGGVLLSTLLKVGFDRSRPAAPLQESHAYLSSFPSGHAMMAAVTYLTLSALLAQVHERRRVKGFLLSVAIVLTVLVGLSRVYLGVHWPTDVLAGWAAGSAWAFCCWLGVLWLRHRDRRGEKEPGA